MKLNVHQGDRQRMLVILAGHYPPGKTQVEKTEAFKKLVAEIERTQNGVTISLSSTISRVDWRDGVAKIGIAADKKDKRPAQSPLSMSRVDSFDILATKEEALKIKPEMPFLFRGKVQFHPHSWLGVGTATKSQALYMFRCSRLSPDCVGTFTSSEYEIKIGDKVYPGRWQAPKAEKERAEQEHLAPDPTGCSQASSSLQGDLAELESTGWQAASGTGPAE